MPSPCVRALSGIGSGWVFGRALQSLTSVTSICVLLAACAVPLAAQTRPAAPTTRQDDRIIFLLTQLADQARASEDIAFAVRAQTQAALLMWGQDRDRARAILRRAFLALLPSSPACQTSPAPEAAEKRQLRAELLNQIASRDPEMAEVLARALTYSLDLPRDEEATPPAPDSSNAVTAVPGRAKVERRELLVSVALRIAEHDRHRAMALGQLSLAAGISPDFGRLLSLMRAADPVLADLLFASAVDRLERVDTISLSDIHTLGSYLISAAGPSGRDFISRSVMTRFLNLAFEQVMRQGYGAQADAMAADESSTVYFVCRQLADLFARHLPDRLGQLQRRLAEVDDREPFDPAIDTSAPQASRPFDIAREARNSPEGAERDLLYARAALGWLARGDTGEAQSAASLISEAEVRDRVLIQIVRRQMSEGRIEDAVAVVRHIEDRVAESGLMARLAEAALSSRDIVRATELLNESETEAAKIETPLTRAQSLLAIVASFSAFDAVRAFEVMQQAVKSINEIPAPSQQSRAPDQAGPGVVVARPQELYRLNFESTLAVLARTDFDRALLLAQQLTGKEASLIAQLAVCRGGFRSQDSGFRIQESGAN